MILMRFSTAYAKESDVYSFSNSTCAYGTSDASPPYTLSELSVHLSFALEFLFLFMVLFLVCSFAIWFRFYLSITQDTYLLAGTWLPFGIV